MSSISQLARMACLPLAMGLFLAAAQTSGGFQFRDTPVTRIAMK